MSQTPDVLNDLQQQMLAWLQVGDTRINDSVFGTEKVPAQIRLDIYAHAYKYRLVEALEDTFPALNTLMGDEDFFNLGVAYINAHPSQHFSLRYFGHLLSSFLASDIHYKEQVLLSEMAQFEWLLRAAFDAKDGSALTLESLQTINPDSWPILQFEFHQSINQITLQYNTPQLWKAIDQQLEPIDIICHEHAINWLIWRKDLRNYYRSIEVDEAWALRAMINGSNFSEVCTGVCEWVDEQHVAMRVAGFIQNWINEDLIIDIIY